MKDAEDLVGSRREGRAGLLFGRSGEGTERTALPRPIGIGFVTELEDEVVVLSLKRGDMGVGKVVFPVSGNAFSEVAIPVFLPALATGQWGGTTAVAGQSAAPYG